MRHVFKNFWLLSYCNKLVITGNIMFDETGNKVYHSSKVRNVSVLFWVSTTLWMFYDVTRYMLSKSVWTKTELIYIVEVPCLCLMTIFYKILFGFKYNFAHVLENMQTLEVLLSKHYDYNKTNRFANYIITLIGLSCATFSLNLLLAIYYYIFVPDLKIYAVQGILGVPTGFYILFLSATTFLLADRSSLLSKNIEKFAKEYIGDGTCDLCNNESKSKITTLCTKHQIK